MSWLSILLICMLVLFCCWLLDVLGYLFYVILVGLWEWVVRPSFVLKVLSFFVNNQVTFLHCFVHQIVEFFGRVFGQYVEIIYMSLLQFLARNHSEDADENMVVVACMDHTRVEWYWYRRPAGLSDSKYYENDCKIWVVSGHASIYITFCIPNDSPDVPLKAVKCDGGQSVFCVTREMKLW